MKERFKTLKICIKNASIDDSPRTLPWHQFSSKNGGVYWTECWAFWVWDGYGSTKLKAVCSNQGKWKKKKNVKYYHENNLSHGEESKFVADY